MLSFFPKNGGFFFGRCGNCELCLVSPERNGSKEMGGFLSPPKSNRVKWPVSLLRQTARSVRLVLLPDTLSKPWFGLQQVFNSFSTVFQLQVNFCLKKPSLFILLVTCKLSYKSANFCKLLQSSYCQSLFYFWKKPLYLFWW